jgi:hypothetical protein
MKHPILGTLVFQPGDGGWVGNWNSGNQVGIDVLIGGTKKQIFEYCEQLAIAFLTNLDERISRLYAYVQAIDSTFTQEFGSDWSLEGLELTKNNASQTCEATFTLAQDTYGWWIVTIVEGEPVKYLRLQQ